KTRKRIGPDHEEQLEELPEELPDLPETSVTGPDGEPVEVEEPSEKSPEEPDEEEEISYSDLEENVKNNIEKQDPLTNESLETLLTQFWRSEPFKNTGFVLEGFPGRPRRRNSSPRPAYSSMERSC
ncbi:hypothetical protein BOX15_Mlig023982g3, partial [Macrostomum lignano]